MIAFVLFILTVMAAAISRFVLNSFLEKFELKRKGPYFTLASFLVASALAFILLNFLALTTSFTLALALAIFAAEYTMNDLLKRHHLQKRASVKLGLPQQISNFRDEMKALKNILKETDRRESSLNVDNRSRYFGEKGPGL